MNATAALSAWRLGRRWWTEPLAWVELFLIANIGFLAVDIYIAHKINEFAHPAEWIPVIVSLVATPVLAIAVALGGPRPALARRDEPDRPGGVLPLITRWIGLAIGWICVVVGIAGLIYHLRSDFFFETTVKNLVYTAPFCAPLAYSGLGLLLILNRMVDSRTLEWSRWVLLLAMGGFLGNFALSLADHAQNGFFHPAEWIGVISAALAVGFLLAAALFPADRTVIRLGHGVMLLQVVVGLLGFGLHVQSNLQRPGGFVDQFLYGSPVFAPLLFADVAVLGSLGLWAHERAAVATGLLPPLGGQGLARSATINAG